MLPQINKHQWITRLIDRDWWCASCGMTLTRAAREHIRKDRTRWNIAQLCWVTPAQTDANE
jgi:hypothetical protein